MLDYDSDEPARFERSDREDSISQLQLGAGYASSHPLGGRVPDHEPEAGFAQMPVRRQPFQLPPSSARLEPAPPLAPQKTYQLQQPPGQCTQKRPQQKQSPLSFLQILGDAEHDFHERQTAEQHPRINGSRDGYNSKLGHSQPGPSINGSAKSSQAGLAAAESSADRRCCPLKSRPQDELGTTPNGQRSRQQSQPSNSFDSPDDFLDGLLLAQAAVGNRRASKELQGKQVQDGLLGSLLGIDQPTLMSGSQQTDEQKLLAVLMDPSVDGFLLPDGGPLQNNDIQAKACAEQLNDTAADSLLGGLLLAESSSAEPQTGKQPENGGPEPAAPQRLPECISDPVWSESAGLTDMLSSLGVSARQPQEGTALEGQCNGVDAQPAVDGRPTGLRSTATSPGQESPASKTADPAQDRPSTDEDPLLAELTPRLSNAHSLAAEQPPSDLHSLLFGDELAAATPDKQAADHASTGSGSTTPHAVQQSGARQAAGCDGSSQSSGSRPCSFSEWLQMPSPVHSASGPEEPAVTPECSASGPAEPAVVPAGGAQHLSCILCGHTAPSVADLVAHITSEAHLALKQLMSARRKRTPRKSSPGEPPVLSTCSKISQVCLTGDTCCHGCCSGVAALDLHVLLPALLASLKHVLRD